MTLDEFADWVHAIGLRPSVTDDPEKHLAYLALGLAGEAGEAVEVVKKHLRDGPLDMALMRHTGFGIVPTAEGADRDAKMTAAYDDIFDQWWGGL